MKKLIYKRTIKVYKKSNLEIILGDSFDVLANYIKDESIDLIIADPPYNIGKNFNGFLDKWTTETDYLNWTYNWIDLCIKKLKPNGSMYLLCSTQAYPYLDLYLRQKMNILSRIIWCYDSSSVQAKNHFGSMYEPIIFCVKDKNNYTFNARDILVNTKTGSLRNLIDYRNGNGKPYNPKKIPGNIWFYHPRVRFRMSEYQGHPTQKPEGLIERMIKASTKKGAVVLDPFAGSFTTASVAQRLDRKSISIEINKDYLNTGLSRLKFRH